MRRVAGIVLFSFLSACVTLAQTSAAVEPSRPQGSTLSGATGPGRSIQLNVQITDKSGAPVRGLQSQDLVVLDDKQPLELLSFREVHDAAGEIEIVLVVDEV